jgi:threonyl-tRNA synthetase
MKIKVGLSTRPDQFIGDIDTWNKAEEILKSILEDYPGYEIYEKDGAFYGNKIDCKVTDAFGREHQLATVQLDFNLPERFELEYKDSTGNNVRPVMIHRAIFGSVERFIGILLESTQGKLPFFVNPRQIAIVPTKSDSEQINNYCVKLYEGLKKLNYNVDFISGNETMQKKLLTVKCYIIIILP